MMKHEYLIYGVASKKIFDKQCQALEKHIPELQKGKHLVDVDSSEWQHYTLGKEKIVVSTEKQVNGVFVQASFDLAKYMENLPEQ